MDYLLFALSPIIVGWPLLANILFVFYWIVTLMISLVLSKIITRRSKWVNWKVVLVIFLLLNIPPAAVPLFTFSQWSAMCLAQDDYVVHSTFDTPSEFLGTDGFPSFVSDYRGEFRLPLEGLDLEIVDRSSRIDESIYKKNILVQNSKSKNPIFEYSVLTYGDSGFPRISFIYREIPPFRCGYNSSMRAKRKYNEVMESVFINRDLL